MDGLKLGLGIAAAFGLLWVLGWVLVLMMFFISNEREKGRRGKG